ncbi:hypothetical protein G4B88_001060 [Cannabis sativa]|uniref:Uncharacterized protein n=2 Tax=Cannabis sativa TaxID=3483 RepID=A0A7J6DJ03_CANSA|nr:hypothetical protein G4B88_001060 [Cannabis sativa]
MLYFTVQLFLTLQAEVFLSHRAPLLSSPPGTESQPNGLPHSFSFSDIVMACKELRTKNTNSIRVLLQLRQSVSLRGASTMDFFGDMENQGSTMAMDVDDVDQLEILGESVIADNKLTDADFFNSFEDDFDDSNIN